MDMTKDELYQLKIQLDLGPYEKRSGRLQQSGREYRAWCPWHEKTRRATKARRLQSTRPRMAAAGALTVLRNAVIKRATCLSLLNLMTAYRLAKCCVGWQNEAGIIRQQPKAKLRRPRRISTNQLERFEINPDVMVYLAGRGIDERTAIDAGLGLVDYPGIGPAIAIPYTTNVQVPRT